MTREASVATLRRLAEAVDRAVREQKTTSKTIGVTEIDDALAAYRSEIAPLRTREQVDAELVAWIRESVNTKRHINDTWETVLRLCRESTAPGPAPTPGRWRVGTRVPEHVYLDDKPICTMPSADLARAVVAAMNSGPSSADAEEVPSPRPPASPAGADLLQRAAWEQHPIYERSKCIRTEHEAATTGDCRYCRECMNKPCRWWSGWRPSGPPGAVAAKESTDNAAAPEGAANERECNCDQALGLEQKLADIRTEYELWTCCRKGSTETLGAIHLILGDGP